LCAESRQVTLSPPPAGIPITIEQDWTSASSSLETGDDAGTMAFEVNDTAANLSGASGRFTAGEFSEGVTRVSVTEDLTNEDVLVRLQGLGPRHRAGVRLRTVGDTTKWTSNRDSGGWTTAQVNISNTAV
jgi:hypothetical protein